MIGEVKLGEICEKVNYGYTASAEYSHVGPKFLRITDIVSETIDWDKVPYCQIEEKNVPKFLLKEGDIVIARTGATVGYAKYIKRGIPTTVFASYLVRIRLKKDCNARYIGFLIESENYKRFIKANIGGAAQPQANAQILTSYPTSFPSLSTQRKIAAILSAYDDLIDNNTRRIKILEETAQTIYKEWFVKFRFPGYESVKMMDSELGKIPEGWEVKEINEIVENTKKPIKSSDLSNDLFYLPIDLIPRKSMLLQETKPLSEAKSSLIYFKKGDILFGSMRSYFHKVIIAPFNGVTRTTCFIFRPKSDYLWSFSYLTLFQEGTVSYANQHSNGATIPYAVWKNGLSTMEIIVPSKKILQNFEKKISPLLRKIMLCFFKNQNLRKTRDLLLPKLISGGIDVEDMSINTERADLS